MLGRIIYSIAIGVAAALVLLLIGTVLVSMDVPILKTIGDFLKEWCWVIGVITAVLTFFSGRSLASLR